MLLLIAIRNLLVRPKRSFVLLGGYGLGVAVMIVLLSVGEALVAQARQERLVGGGDITVLPEGIDVEVMKTGGLGGLFFSIDHARFIYRQLLAAPRLTPVVRAVAPEIDSKALYLRTPDGAERVVVVSGEIPSRMAAVGASAGVAAGAWRDDSIDVGWTSPTPMALRNDIDHFHLPPDSVARDPSWAEWHYFNVLSADHRRWVFVSFIVAGRVRGGAGAWGGEALVTLHEQGRGVRRFASAVPSTAVRFSTQKADVAIGGSTVKLLPDGRYAVHARASPDGEPNGAPVDVDLVVAPAPDAYFPGAALSSGELVSGYVVPALRADADGRVCVATDCLTLHDAQAYHDHNWGVWRGVTWEWGSARAGNYSILYGRVQPSSGDGSAGGATATEPLFLFVVDSLGFAGVFRPTEIAYVDGRSTTVAGHVVDYPSHATMVDVRGDDTLRVELTIDDATATDTRRPAIERGGAGAVAARNLTKPYFVQMKGTARLTGRLDGHSIDAMGAGFFETYR